MECLKSSKWIWINNNDKDTYAEFYQQFIWTDGKTTCRISCDGDYTLFLNGKYVSSKQYEDFEHYKIYDELDITSFLVSGENHFAVLVWHIGEETSRHITATPGLIYEIAREDNIVAISDESTVCRQSNAYRNGCQKWITPQMGFSFLYDATKEDGWIDGNLCGEFVPADVVKKECDFFPCPIRKIRPNERVHSKILKKDENYYLIDLGKETVGIPVLEFFSKEEQSIRVDWGEDLQDNHVRRIIDMRDFSFEYIAKQGKNEYTNYMFCMGARYMEVYSESPIEIAYIGIRPRTYQVEAIKQKFENPLDQSIYDVCVDTLKLCMLEHYVDTPWREQCLYAFDARNQMLCGYYAFAEKNAEYARENLKLISKDRREDGLLSITYPCGVDLTIPSFSMYYFMAVNEYLTHTGDISLGVEVYPKLLSILDTFLRGRKDGLIYKFEGTNHWNFYDWSQYLDGNLHGTEEAVPDLMINCLFIVALKNLQEIAYKVNGSIQAYQELIDESILATKETFYNEKNRLFSLIQNGCEYTVLGNAFAILAGVAEKAEGEYICTCIAEGKLSDCSLSMKTFKYDAMLCVDREKYAPRVLEEIRADYGKMLNNGATSVWETIDGAAAFDNAGSLCHGWSAIPVYYYHLLTK